MLRFLQKLPLLQNSILRRIFLYIFFSTLIIALLFIAVFSLESMRDIDEVSLSHGKSIVDTVASQLDAYFEQAEQMHTLFFASEFVRPYTSASSRMPSLEWFEEYYGARTMLQFCMRSNYHLVSGMQLRKGNGETITLGSFGVTSSALSQLGERFAVSNGHAFYSSGMGSGANAASMTSQFSDSLFDNLCASLVSDDYCLQLITRDGTPFKTYGDESILSYARGPFASADTAGLPALRVALYSAGGITLRELLDDIMRWLPTLLLLTMISGIILSYVFSSRMSSGFRLMEHNIESVSQRRYADVRVLDSDDEFGRMSRTFADMAQSIQALIAENELQRRNQFDLEIQVLRAQVSPHFLYNSLGSVHQLALMQGNLNIASLTTAIIKLLRAAIATSEALVPLMQEIDSINNYYEICKYQYLSDIAIETDISDEAKGCMLPPMTLQPIVENAVIHGIANYRADGKINIRAAAEGGALVITIEDNGRGMTPEQLETLLTQKRNQSRQRFSGIGLYNVRQRIEMRFGAPYGMNITSEPGEYTRVVLTLPIIGGER